MKIGRTSIRMLGAFLALALLGLDTHVGAQEDQMKLSFDSIFPATPYKEALGSCMQVLGYLDQLCHEHQRGEEMAFCLVHDAFLGKVVSAQHKIANLLANIQTGAIVADDNVHYLSNVLTHINQLYQQHIDQNQRNTLSMNMLQEMAQQVSRLIEQ